MRTDPVNTVRIFRTTPPSARWGQNTAYNLSLARGFRRRRCFNVGGEVSRWQDGSAADQYFGRKRIAGARHLKGSMSDSVRSPASSGRRMPKLSYVTSIGLRAALYQNRHCFDHLKQNFAWNARGQ